MCTAAIIDCGSFFGEMDEPVPSSIIVSTFLKANGMAKRYLIVLKAVPAGCGC
jgi:hypothetical protein